MRRVETKGSFWIFDDDTNRYLRMPKEEKPRAAEWSVGALKDLEWHPMIGWKLLTRLDDLDIEAPRLSPKGLPWLRIELGEDDWVSAPKAVVFP